MAEEPSPVDEGSGKSFFKELSSAAAKKALMPLLATAATAGTTYLIRKTTEIWQDDVLPKVRERGGGKAVAKEALEKTADRLSGRPAQLLTELAERLGEAAPTERPADWGSAEKGGTTGPEAQREQERKQRQQRRQQRQRALQKSAST
jgi:hypothetical protein